ncbi:NAD-dependent epimerase/dehydratase family protein [Candidatus Dependentiae bacterium]|nr:NAD-dependent epimerase/dehydratase family protein [Candidatus Dependentiae bacterium]
MKFKKFLITGGCGFLGQHLVNDLVNEFSDLKIKILDLKPNPKPLFDFSDNPNVEVSLQKDICDYGSIENEFMNIDLVIHLVGLISFSLKDKELLEKVNILGTKNILKAISSNKIKNLIHISSVAALGYRDDKNEAINETYDYDWNIAKKRKKYYMLTKHLADIEIENYIKEGLNAVILYPGLMFGPGDLTNSSKLIRAIKYRRIPFNMPGGTNVIDVRDVSAGIVAILRKGIYDGNYLLSGYNLTIKDVNNIIAKELGVKPPKLTLLRILGSIMFNLVLVIESKVSRELEVAADNIDSAFKFRYFNNLKAKRELEWSPKISFRKTINDTIKWMDENGLFEK